jgi:membrane protein DedA with SNARE-associated domain
LIVPFGEVIGAALERGEHLPALLFFCVALDYLLSFAPGSDHLALTAICSYLGRGGSWALGLMMVLAAAAAGIWLEYSFGRLVRWVAQRAVAGPIVERVAGTIERFRRDAAVLLLTAQFWPPPRTPLFFLAGAVGVPLLRSSLYGLASAAAWYCAWSALIMASDARVSLVHSLLRTYSLLGWGFIAFGALVILARRSLR